MLLSFDNYLSGIYFEDRRLLTLSTHQEEVSEFCPDKKVSPQVVVFVF